MGVFVLYRQIKWDLRNSVLLPRAISAGLTLRSHRVFTRRVVNASDDVLFTCTRVTLTSSIIYVAVARTAAFFFFSFLSLVRVGPPEINIFADNTTSRR